MGSGPAETERGRGRREEGRERPEEGREGGRGQREGGRERGQMEGVGERQEKRLKHIRCKLTYGDYCHSPAMVWGGILELD